MTNGSNDYLVYGGINMSFSGGSILFI